MLKKLLIAAVVAQLSMGVAFAQATRAEVKAEGASANKAGKVIAAEGTTEPSGKSVKPRTDVKKEGGAANKAGEVTAAEGTTEPKGKSSKARPEVKKEAASANKAGAKIAGEDFKR